MWSSRGCRSKRLRFILAGDASVVYSLYELFSQNCIEIQLRDPKDEKRLISLSPERLNMVGFDAKRACCRLCAAPWMGTGFFRNILPSREVSVLRSRRPGATGAGGFW